MSIENYAKMSDLVKQTGLSENELIGLGLNLERWIVSTRSILTNPLFAAITADRREQMPEFPFLERLK
jgi:hypothetical protein